MLADILQNLNKKRRRKKYGFKIDFKYFKSDSIKASYHNALQVSYHKANYLQHLRVYKNANSEDEWNNLIEGAKFRWQVPNGFGATDKNHIGTTHLKNSG